MLIPKNRHEYYLAVISGNDYPTFPPKIREEMYLAKLAGREIDVPSPKTPKERAYYNIINDIKFDPENRWQTFVAAANDDSITAPVPRTREEIWWSNISLSHEVIVEYVGTLPATLQTVEGYLESYKIYGNTVQASTPTPEDPIVPSGCGEKVDITGLSEPLYGIDAYTDSLDLSTGILTRKIKKLALTGEENGWGKNEIVPRGDAYVNTAIFNDRIANYNRGFCSHLKPVVAPSAIEGIYFGIGVNFIINKNLEIDTTDKFKSYLSQQYAAGTPVTVWYVLAEPEVSTIPVPSGLTEIVEGYLTQEGTPTPETPIYPTANGVKQADGTYSIPYGYKLPLTSGSTSVDIYIGDDTLSAEEYVDSATGKIYRRTENLSPPEEEWIDGQIGGGDGTVSPSTEIKVSPFIDVSTCETCIMEVFSAETEWAAAGYREMAFYAENKQYLGWIGGGGRQTLTPNSTERLSEFPAGTAYVRIGCSHGDQPFYPQLVSGYTPTHQFYSYLVPTDPPASFPQIPTAAGNTIIDYDGTPKPDKVELTYKTVERAYISSDDEVYQDTNGQLLGG